MTELRSYVPYALYSLYQNCLKVHRVVDQYQCVPVPTHWDLQSVTTDSQN